ncbi:MAG: 30S ribosomal protein S6 [Patescibacteria group bacterium]
MTSESKYYELSYWLTSGISEEEASSAHEELRTLLDSHSAIVESWDSPRRRNLAYPIRKEREGYFGAFRFTVASDQVYAIDKKTRDRKSILRSMLLGWQHAPTRQYVPRPQTAHKEEQVATDVQALDKRLEEILGPTPNESQ